MLTPPTINPSERRDTVTLLQAIAGADAYDQPVLRYDHHGRLIQPLAVKKWCVVKGKISKQLEYPQFFKHHTIDVDGLSAWFDALRQLQRQPHMMRISGCLKSNATLTRTPHGDLVMRRYADALNDPFEGQPLGTHLIAVDIDELEPDNDADFTTRKGRANIARWAIHKTLPKAFHDAEVVIQWSSSAGMHTDDNGRWSKIKLHCWFWADRPIYCASLKEYFQASPYVDRALYQPVQPHHVAAPVFRDGLSDPLSEWRTDLLPGQPFRFC